MSNPFHVSSDSHPSQTIRAGINEARLLGQLKHLFSSSHSAVGELMQNARRAGATVVDFEFDPATDSMTITDDGCGIADFGALVHLCSSGWDEETMLAERPFGMGLFSLLFAAGEITLRSRGHCIRLTQADVTKKRAIAVLPDASAPARGTRIELRALEPAFVGKVLHPHGFDKTPLDQIYQVCGAIENRARGFPIAVRLKGADVRRPLAQTALPGEMTSIGFVSMRGVHRDMEAPIGRQYGRDGLSLFLQGLPIDANRGNLPHTVVHLDQHAFTPMMPDRTRLYDADAAYVRIRDVLRQLVRDHLIRRKTALSGADFVLCHWDDCKEYQMQGLLDDIPYIPRKSVCVISEVTQHDSDGYLLDFKAGIDPQRPESAHLVSRDDIVSGKVRIWRDVPSCPSDAPSAALVLKVMQREDIGTVLDPLGPNHWIHGCTSNVEDLRFSVTPMGAHGHADYVEGDWIDHCDIQLVDRIDIEVTSAVDPAVSLQLTIERDWLLLPADYATGGLEETAFDGTMERAVCFVTNAPGGDDHPAAALSAFTDGDDFFHEEWRDRAVDLWDALVAGLRGKGLAPIVAAALASSSVCPSVSHLGDLAIVRADACGVGGRTVFSVVDPASEFWLQVAQQFGATPVESADVNALAAQIEAAVRTVVLSAGRGCLAQGILRCRHQAGAGPEASASNRPVFGPLALM